MSTITFSGLASGLDTDSIIESLMEIERQPIDRMESDIEYFELETAAYADFDSLLGDLRSAVASMDSLYDITNYSVTSSDTSLLTATANSSAIAGSYHVEVVSLAEAQRDISAEGFADTDSELLSGTLTIGDVTIDYSDVTLAELKDMVNDADAGVSASIVNDGSESGYRLLFRGEQAGVTTEITGTGSIAIDTATDGHTYSAARAHVVVDNVDFYSDSNTLTSVIPGLTIDLYGAESGTETTLTVASDTTELSSAIDNFVDAYNAIVEWISDQEEEESSWANDSSIVGAKRKLQNFLTTTVGSSGTFSSLAQLGFETDYETGLISVDSSTLNEALTSDLDSVLALFAGTDETDGVADLFYDYLDEQTDSTDGISARRQDANDANIERINKRIEIMEMRLEKREDALKAQYTALETLISEMNSQTSYLDELSALSKSSS